MVLLKTRMKQIIESGYKKIKHSVMKHLNKKDMKNCTKLNIMKSFFINLLHLNEKFKKNRTIISSCRKASKLVNHV